MEFLHNTYLHIILSSVAVYIFIILAIRLFGKKELSQLSVFDLVFILLISNAVQNAMVLGDNTLYGGIAAALALFTVNYILKKLQLKFPKFGRLVQGDAIMLVYHGKMIPSHLRMAGITEEEVMQSVREHGVASVADVDLAVLEVDGNISVLSNDFKKRTQRRRKAHKVLTAQN
ncbi:MAG: YetF domain-containing protein [Bacteroidota bacterium]